MSQTYGVRLLDRLPNRAWFASVRADSTLARRIVEVPDLLRWIGRIQPEDKVAPRLLSAGVPAHAVRPSGRAALIVQFFEDTPVDEQRRALERHDARIIARIAPINGWEVELPADRLLALAREDATQWIVDVPRGPETDNDGVRSASGVNADAVLAPTAYNLSGAGVTVALFDWHPASLTHVDLAGRITLGDATIFPRSRTHGHDEKVAANNQFDQGEGIYADVDDSGKVSPNDFRLNGAGGFAAGSVVQAGNSDVGQTLVVFQPGDAGMSVAGELFVDLDRSLAYNEGEPIYRDLDFNGIVSAADARLTTQSAVTGAGLSNFPINPHHHATKVAGTIMGSGANSATQGGAALQWKGVAPAAQLLTFDVYGGLWTEYAAAQAQGAVAVANPWGPHLSHCHQIHSPYTCYTTFTELNDAAVSGLTKTGLPSNLNLTIIGSAGNVGRPERHTENIAGNGQYDPGEAIYIDRDQNGRVTPDDLLVDGASQPADAPLIVFRMAEKHAETVSDTGSYEPGEAIYLDNDNSNTVTIGDVRIADGSTVAAGDPDLGRLLRQFKLWGNLRTSNSAKSAIQVGAIATDALYVPSWSSRGPTGDGRMKPDLVVAGTEQNGEGGVRSTFPGDRYEFDKGTSMSVGAAAGSVALLTQWYRDVCVPGVPPPDAIKALLLHAAEDVVTTAVGDLPGPDFISGFGRLRVKEAVDLVPHHVRGSIGEWASVTHTVTLGAAESLKVTLVWSDPPSTPNGAPHVESGLLLNDLDLLVIGPDGTQYTPWLLEPNNPFAAATRQSFGGGVSVPGSARDRRNPVEQVLVENAAAGTWTIVVSSNEVSPGPQSYTLVSETLPAQASPCASQPAADVWMRDNPTDTGAVPSSGSLWLGPDLWNRLAADNSTVHENPEHGQPNYLYANIRNASAVPVKATTIEVWIAPASLGLIWPTNFMYVGRIVVPNLAANEVRQVGPIVWNPPSPAVSGHFCLYMRVVSPQDPIGLIETASIGQNAGNSNNIAYRNVNIVDLHSSAAVSFLVRNTERDPQLVDIRLDVPGEFLNVGEVRIILSDELMRRWVEQPRQLAGLTALDNRTQVVTTQGSVPAVEGRGRSFRIEASRVVLRGFRMSGGQSARATLVFSSPQQSAASYEIDVVEVIAGRDVGGIRYIVRTGPGRQ